MFYYPTYAQSSYLPLHPIRTLCHSSHMHFSHTIVFFILTPFATAILQAHDSIPPDQLSPRSAQPKEWEKEDPELPYSIPPLRLLSPSRAARGRPILRHHRVYSTSTPSSPPSTPSSHDSSTPHHNFGPALENRSPRPKHPFHIHIHPSENSPLPTPSPSDPHPGWELFHWHKASTSVKHQEVKSWVSPQPSLLTPLPPLYRRDASPKLFHPDPTPQASPSSPPERILPLVMQPHASPLPIPLLTPPSSPVHRDRANGGSDRSAGHEREFYDSNFPPLPHSRSRQARSLSPPSPGPFEGGSLVHLKTPSPCNSVATDNEDCRSSVEERSPAPMDDGHAGPLAPPPEPHVPPLLPPAPPRPIASGPKPPPSKRPKRKNGDSVHENSKPMLQKRLPPLPPLPTLSFSLFQTPSAALPRESSRPPMQLPYTNPSRKYRNSYLSPDSYRQRYRDSFSTGSEQSPIAVLNEPPPPGSFPSAAGPSNRRYSSLQDFLVGKDSVNEEAGPSGFNVPTTQRNRQFAGSELPAPRIPLFHNPPTQPQSTASRSSAAGPSKPRKDDVKKPLTSRDAVHEVIRPTSVFVYPTQLELAPPSFPPSLSRKPPLSPKPATSGVATAQKALVEEFSRMSISERDSPLDHEPLRTSDAHTIQPRSPTPKHFEPLTTPTTPPPGSSTPSPNRPIRLLASIRYDIQCEFLQIDGFAAFGNRCEDFMKCQGNRPMQHVTPPGSDGIEWICNRVCRCVPSYLRARGPGLRGAASGDDEGNNGRGGEGGEHAGSGNAPPSQSPYIPRLRGPSRLVSRSPVEKPFVPSPARPLARPLARPPAQNPGGRVQAASLPPRVPLLRGQQDSTFKDPRVKSSDFRSSSALGKDSDGARPSPRPRFQSRPLYDSFFTPPIQYDKSHRLSCDYNDFHPWPIIGHRCEDFVVCEGKNVVRVIEHPESYNIDEFCTRRCHCQPVSSRGKDKPEPRGRGNGLHPGFRIDERDVRPSQTLQEEVSVLVPRSPFAKQREQLASPTSSVALVPHTLHCGLTSFTRYPYVGTRCELFVSCHGTILIPTMVPPSTEIWNRCTEVCQCIPAGLPSTRRRGGAGDGRPPLHPSSQANRADSQAPASGATPSQLGIGDDNNVQVMQDLSRLRVPRPEGDSSRTFPVRHPAAPPPSPPSHEPRPRRFNKRDMLPSHNHQAPSSLVAPRSPVAKQLDDTRSSSAAARPPTHFLRCSHLRITTYPHIGDNCADFMGCNGGLRKCHLQSPDSLKRSSTSFL